MFKNMICKISEYRFSFESETVAGFTNYLYNRYSRNRIHRTPRGKEIARISGSGKPGSGRMEFHFSLYFNLNFRFPVSVLNFIT